MSKEEKLETGAEGAESSTVTEGTAGAETTGSAKSEEAAEGNFLTDLIGESGEGESAAAGSETKPTITVETAGEDVAVGDKLLQDGQPLLNGSFTAEDGTVYMTDAEGKITEITEPEGGGEEDDGLFELKWDDDVEKFDLTKKEDLEKVREYAQKGRMVEKTMEGVNKDKAEVAAEREQLGTQRTAIAHNLLYLQMNGKVSAQDFVELPYEDFVGSSEKRDDDGNVTAEATKEGDLANWNKHKQQVAANNKVLGDYSANFKKTAESYRKLVSDFQTKHPEIKDVKAWINDNLGKFSAPILTFGAEEYHPDTLEMVWHWMNKDRIIKEAREDERRKKAKAVVKVEPSSKAGKISVQPVDTFINSVVNKGDTRKIVH